MGYDPEYFLGSNINSSSGNGSVDESLLCPICHSVYDTPMVLDPCGHSFCKSCVTELFESGHENCPVCRTPMIEGDSVGIPPNRALNGLISNMTVRCMNCPCNDDNNNNNNNNSDNNNANANNCCPWTGKLSEFQSHSERDCPMHVVSCPVQGCNYEGPRSSMNQHNIDSIALHTDLIIASRLEQIKEELLGATRGETGNSLISTNGNGNGNGSSGSGNLSNRLDELHVKMEQKDQEIKMLKARLLDNWMSDFFREWIIAKPPYFQNFVVYRPIKHLTGPISQIIVGIPGPGNSYWEGGLYPLLITFTPEGFERKEPPKCDFPETFFHPNIYEGNVHDNILVEFEGSWDPSISLQELLFCIQQLLTHPNHRGVDYDIDEYCENIQLQAQKYDPNGVDFLERAMVELQSKIDPEYKMPLESWENERWENLEEVRWKGRRSFQSQNEPRTVRRRTGNINTNGLAILSRIESPEDEEEVQFIMTTNSSASLLSASASNDENDDGVSDPVLTTTTSGIGLRRSVLAPIANANSTDFSPPAMQIEADRPRGPDGMVCECSCCEQGSRSFIDREHRMRYIFGEGG